MPDKEDDNTNKTLWGVGSKSLEQGVDGRGKGLKRCNKENTRHLCVVINPYLIRYDAAPSPRRKNDRLGARKPVTSGSC